jgi:hypothetical protein
MNDQDQNLAVAKIHGWEEIQHNPKTGLWYGKPPKDAAHPWDVVVPDYGKDLNAMHRVEMILLPAGTYPQRSFYASELGRITCNDNGNGWKPLSNDNCFPILHASASQRREALLRCLNLWTEE